MSDRIQLMFAAATVLIMKAVYALHRSHIGLNLPAAQPIYHVVDLRLLSAKEMAIFSRSSSDDNTWTTGGNT